MKNNPLVSVIMITYNHEKYIKQAIEGVFIQKCDFEIEFIISNDCSTDDTHEVIQKLITNYTGEINIRYYNHKKNKGVIPNSTWSLSQANGKYIALCEGDDYWTDPLKLQKQVGFLEENEDIGLVSTLRENFTQSSGITVKEPSLITDIQICTFYEVVFGCRIATLTVLVRNSLIKDFVKLFTNNTEKISSYDYTIWIYISYFSKIAILNEYTAVYRILKNSISHNKNKWNLKKEYFKDFLFLTNHFNLSEEVIIKKAIYLRAKSFYLIAIKAKDYNSCNNILKILKQNKDYPRIVIGTIVKKVPSSIPFFQFLERVNFKLKKHNV